MEDCLRCLCCCFDFQPSPRQRSSTRSKRRPAKEYRLSTKYKKQDLLKISDQDRKSGRVKAYCCPICILSCGECTNCMCLNCFQSYDEKSIEKNHRMKCPFCNSVHSVFSDYQLDPHSYFDTTNKGFLSKEQRLKIDNELKPSGNSLQLPAVPEQTEQVMEETISQP